MEYPLPQSPNGAYLYQVSHEWPFAYTGAAGEIPYYSIANEANQKLYEQYRGLVEHIPNVWLLGRLAEYKYYNIDAMVLKALELTDKIKKDKEV